MLGLPCDDRAVVAVRLDRGGPPINHPRGFGWPLGYELPMLTATFNAIFYGHVLTKERRNALLPA